MKFVSSPSYKIKLFENSKSSGFIESMSIYTNAIPPELRTSSNEIIEWIDEYNIIFEDELLIFGLYEDNKIIGFSQGVFFNKEKFIVIDYLVIDKQYRGNHTFQMFIALFKKFLEVYKYEYNFIVTEVESKNTALMQLLRSNGFGEIQSKYFQPQLGVNNFESLLKAKLLYHPAYKDKVIKDDTYSMIINTIYDKHYIRWYSKFLSNKKLIKYKQEIESLKKNIFNNLKNEIKITGGRKSINEYDLFNVGHELKYTSTILSIIFIFLFSTLTLGKYFELNIKELIVLVVTNVSMFLLLYSLVSKKGIEQFKLLTKFFDKLK